MPNSDGNFVLSQLALNELAADIFWSYAFRNSLTDAKNAAECIPVDAAMWSIEKAAERLNNGKFRCDQEAARTLYEQVSDVMAVHAREERNINGALYVDEINGVAPSPSDKLNERIIERFSLARDSDAFATYELSRTGNIPIKLGTLYLRSPLPAIVLLTDSEEKSWGKATFIEVDNSSRALGFQKSLFFTVKDFAKLPPETSTYSCVLHGIFSILTTSSYAEGWHKLIQNSTCILDSMSVQLNIGVFEFAIKSR